MSLRFVPNAGVKSNKRFDGWIVARFMDVASEVAAAKEFIRGREHISVNFLVEETNDDWPYVVWFAIDHIAGESRVLVDTLGPKHDELVTLGIVEMD